MLMKLKIILKKISNKWLVGIFLIQTVIIIADKISCDFLFENQFKSEIFETIMAYVNDFKVVYNKWIGIFYIIYILDILFIIFKLILKKDSIRVMIINTFENTKVNISTKYLYENTDFRKDLSREVKLLEENPDGFTKIVRELDNCVKEFLNENTEKNYAFAGILHTPFILRLGYKVGDENYFKLFHKKRNDREFKLLTDKNEYSGNYTKLNVEKSLKESNELVVSISTTFPITKEQLSGFNLDKNNYLKFETIDKGYDVITSEKQVNEYKTIIYNNIKEITRIKDIKVIHLCISSSGAFTFALGQGFSKQHDPEIIIYNYDRQKYTWGLKLFETADKAILSSNENITN